MKNKGSIIVGFLIYCGLVIGAFFLGKALPSRPVKSQPVPHNKRTICTRQPEAFDPSLAKGKKVLITGAAGFVGSHIARFGLASFVAESDGHVLIACCAPAPASSRPRSYASY